MKKQRLSLEEFEALFGERFESRQKLLDEYESFVSTFEQLDRAVVPELSATQKANVFRQSWRARSQRSAWISTLLHLLRQPALTFALGLMVGCILMSNGKDDPIDLGPTASAEPMLQIERTEHSQTYSGKIIADRYPQLENPKLVVEEATEDAPAKRTLHGTVEGGEIYVVWNL